MQSEKKVRASEVIEKVRRIFNPDQYFTFEEFWEGYGGRRVDLLAISDVRSRPWRK